MALVVSAPTANKNSVVHRMSLFRSDVRTFRVVSRFFACKPVLPVVNEPFSGRFATTQRVNQP